MPRIPTVFAVYVAAALSGQILAVHRHTNQRLGLPSTFLGDDDPAAPSAAGTTVSADKGIVMNVYEGDADLNGNGGDELLSGEAEDDEAEEEEVSKLAGAINHLNVEDEEGEKEDMEDEEAKEKHEENAALSMTQSIANELKAETNQLGHEEERVEGDIKKEEDKHDRQMGLLDAEERDEREKTFTEEEKLKRAGHTAEAQLKNEEQVLKEDEARLKDDRVLAKEKLSAIKMDESERISVLDALAKLRGKTAEDITVDDCKALVEHPPPPPAAEPCEEKSLVDEACATTAGHKDNCEEAHKEKKLASVSACGDVFLESRSEPSVTMRNGIQICEEGSEGSEGSAAAPPARREKVKKSSSLKLPELKQEQRVEYELNTGCCEPLDDCGPTTDASPLQAASSSGAPEPCEPLEDPRPFPRLLEVQRKKKKAHKAHRRNALQLLQKAQRAEAKPSRLLHMQRRAM